MAPELESDRTWRLGPERSLTLDAPRLMGVLNVTPDSFSDGGRFEAIDAALAHAHALVEGGASILDVGGASTRPGAAPVDAAEQVRRTVPVIEALRERTRIPISIDTTLAAVAEAALDAGADIVNDVSAGTEDPAILALAADRGCGLVLMHRLTAPEHDSYSDRYRAAPSYDDVAADVAAYLAARVETALARGVNAECIALDAGVGFGKSVAQNYELLRQTSRLAALGHPVLVAASRKSFLGAVSGETEPARRDPESIAAAVLLWTMGARIFRVHDVSAHRRALAVAAAIVSPAAVEPPRAAATIPRPESPPDSPKERTGMAIDIVREFTDSNFQAEVIDASVPVLVDFWAEWCQPCRMLAPTIDEVAKEFEGKVTVGKVDTDANLDISVQYGISAIPTVILFKGGEVVKKFVGLTKKDEFVNAINEVIA